MGTDNRGGSGGLPGFLNSAGQMAMSVPLQFAGAGIHGLQQIGDWFSGAPGKVPPKFNAAAAKKGDLQVRGLPEAGRKPGMQQQADQLGMSLQDFLAMLGMGGGSGGGGGGGGGRVDTRPITDAYNQNDAALESLYRMATASIAAQQPGINENYGAGITGTNAAGQAASSSIASGYQAARDAQTAQLSALGIGDAAAVLANQGGAAAADQARATGNVAQTQNQNVDLLTNNQATSINHNTALGQATAQQGVSSRDMLRQNYQDQIAAAQYGGGGGGGSGGGGGGGGMRPSDMLNGIKTFYDYINPDTSKSTQATAKFMADNAFRNQQLQGSQRNQYIQQSIGAGKLAPGQWDTGRGYIDKLG